MAIQSCVSALDDSFQKCSSHKFADLLSCWCEATQKHIGNDSAEINRFKQKFRCIKYHEQIDQYDPDGLWLRYPTPDLQSNITQQQHCEWPLLWRKLIAEVCSITKYFLEKSDVGTDELDYLVYAAANGSCPGHFGVEIDPTVCLCPDDFAELSEFSRSCISVPFPSFSVEISSD